MAALPYNYILVGHGRLPDGQETPFFVDRRLLDDLEARGLTAKLDDAGYAEEAVTDPDAIFTGLRRPNEAASLCYSVRPTRDPDADPDDAAGESAPPVFGRAFLAFVGPGDIGYLIWDWEWREEDPDEPGHPLHWRDDFEGRSWPRT